MIFDGPDLLRQTLRACPDLELFPLAPDVARAEVTGRSTIQLRAMAGRVGDIGELRAFGAFGPKMTILSTFLYPRATLVMPCYAMEFVILGSRPTVAVIDTPGLAGPMSQALGRRMMRPATMHSDHRPAQDPPDWFAECRSGHDLFERPEPHDLTRLASSHLELVSSWQAVARVAASTNPGAHAIAQQEYRDHHRRHSPGTRFLHRAKGEAWTERLFDVVFGEVREMVG